MKRRIFPQTSKLNERGMLHHIVPLAFIVVFAVLGVGYYVISHAAVSTPDVVSDMVASSSWCVSDLGNNTAANNPVYSAVCNGAVGQQWSFTTGVIKDTAIGTRCLEPNGLAAGAKIVSAACNGSTLEKWTQSGSLFENAGASQGKATGECLAVYGGILGKQLHINSCNAGYHSQNWTLGTYPVRKIPTPTPTPTPPPTAATGEYAPPAGKAYLGVSLNPDDLAAFDKAAGIATQPAIINGYTSADGDMNPIITQAAQHNATPMVSWNVTMSGDAITNGSEDSYIKAQAAEVKAYGKAVFVRLDWEMNGTWYSNYDTSSTTPAEFVASWQHIYNLFKAAAPNAAFVWCPNVGEPNTGSLPVTDWYPGNNYVNWIALDAYPDFTNPPTAELTQTDGMDYFASYAAAQGKPLMLAEWAMGDNGGAGPDTAQVMNIVFNWANQYPDTVGALVYFDYNTFALEDYPVGATAFRGYTGGSSRYILTVKQ